MISVAFDPDDDPGEQRADRVDKLAGYAIGGLASAAGERAAEPVGGTVANVASDAVSGAADEFFRSR
ncbi:hypothetical protein I0C86_19645 [Plantactinospora sp. S1510]|uniref:Uncharacterized protein n=1 Tax=Plantactinospora alkalitolerans TaxID=2789879 RepID=A0ABS0GZ56_9ACTN|nr:hypothetical protein [Plantactinospora alkalitolerans]MBF9131157.1 hypothetical protein [Plantactinospora alkalitolerans]